MHHDIHGAAKPSAEERGLVRTRDWWGVEKAAGGRDLLGWHHWAVLLTVTTIHSTATDLG